MWPRLTFQSETRSLCVRFTFSFTVNTSLTLPASCYYCCQHAGRAVLVHSGAEKSPGRGPTTRVWGKKTLMWAFRTPEVAFSRKSQRSSSVDAFVPVFSSEQCNHHFIQQRVFLQWKMHKRGLLFVYGTHSCFLCFFWASLHVSVKADAALRRTAWTGGGGLQLKQLKQHALCQICRWMCRQVSAEPGDAEVSWLWHQITVQHQLSAGF